MTGPMTAVDSKQRERDITGQLLFSVLLPQDSIHDNNVQLKQKKSHRRVGWVWSVSCRYEFPSRQLWITGRNQPSRECPGMFLKRSKDCWLALAGLQKIHQKAAATTNSLISSVTTHTTSRTKVLEKQFNWKAKSTCIKWNKLSSIPAVAQKWGQRLQKGTRIYWQ